MNAPAPRPGLCIRRALRAPWSQWARWSQWAPCAPWALCALWALTAWAVSPSTASGQTSALRQYRLDPTHTFVTFEVLHFDTATIRGRFGPLQGEVELDPAARRGRVQVAIDVAQVSTGLPVLDTLLRGSDFLQAGTHPTAYFVADGFELNPDGSISTLRGEFTLRGISRGLTLKAERFRCYFSPLLRREVCGGDFIGELRRSDFDITHSLIFVSDTVRLRIQVEGIRTP